MDMNNFLVMVADTSQQHIPASEQQVPEPRKYTGGAIPSRSFRMLQAMTGSEAAGTVLTWPHSYTV